jgi:type IV secretion system protein VirB6
MNGCTELVDVASAGVAPALRAVDCVAGETTALAFNRLFGAEGALAPVLTICLTLYIALFALMLLTGRSRLGVSSLVPRMITLGLVLTFATSWIAYSQFFWNLAVAGPDWIASVLMGSDGSASLMFADRIDIAFAAIAEVGELAAAASAAGAPPPPGGGAGMFAPTDVMWLGALLLLLGTVGVLLTARIALAVLMALGPVFVVLALFPATRGLTAGWLKGLALTALIPLLVVLGGSITLELLVPVISSLSEGAALGIVGTRGAMALFVVASVHVALMAMAMKLAATLVSGWRIFGPAPAERASSDAPAPLVLAPQHQASAPSPASSIATRAPLAVSLPAAGEAASGGSAAGGDASRRAVTTLVTGGGIEPMRAGGQSRARGIGSRFRSANDSGLTSLKSAGRGKAK